MSERRVVGIIFLSGLFSRKGQVVVVEVVSSLFLVVIITIRCATIHFMKAPIMHVDIPNKISLIRFFLHNVRYDLLILKFLNSSDFFDG